MLCRMGVRKYFKLLDNDRALILRESIKLLEQAFQDYMEDTLEGIVDDEEGNVLAVNIKLVRVDLEKHPNIPCY